MYTATYYFDFSATQSCGGSPIFFNFVGTGCSSAVGDNTNGRVCSELPAGSEYTRSLIQCTATPEDISAFTRNYVFKNSYSTSDKCQGDILQGVALAADGMCHYNPSGKNGSMYVTTNCNGGQPIWSECSDAACKSCTTQSFTSDSCQLVGAGASNKVYCVNAASLLNGNSTLSGSGKNVTLPNMPGIGNGASAMKSVTLLHPLFLFSALMYKLMMV
jgi:hypothetical protein